METNARQTCGFANELPRLFQVDPVLAVLTARNNVRIVATTRDLSQHGSSRPVEDYDFGSCLGVRQPHEAVVDVHVAPAERQDLVQTSSGEQKETNCRGGPWRQTSRGDT